MLPMPHWSKYFSGANAIMRSRGKRLQQANVPARRNARRGGAILEMAIVLSLAMTLTFGMVEFAYYFYVKNSFEGAAREGVRAGAVFAASNSNITTAVTNALNTTGWNTASPPYTVSITDTSGNAISDISTITSGSQFEVTLKATWGTIGAGFRPLGLIGTGKVVTATCVMRKEY
jgi:Flp pilus assembly protein TadG